MAKHIFWMTCLTEGQVLQEDMSYPILLEDMQLGRLFVDSLPIIGRRCRRFFMLCSMM